MGYRDDLEAAHARIAQLEGRLKEAERGETTTYSPLASKLVELELRMTSVQEASDAQAQDLLARFETAFQTPAEGMPTVSDHNRSFPPLVHETPAGVLCHLCLSIGERVEMVSDPVHKGVSGNDFTVDGVTCPRCLYRSWKRRTQ